MINTGSITKIDTAGNRTTSTSSGANPLLIDNQNIREQILEKERAKVTERNSLEGKIEAAKERVRKEKPGFLDELNIIYELASSSILSGFAYFLFLFFFIFIELFIVMAKITDGENDYNKIMKYQEKIREERLKILEQKRTASLGENFKIELSNQLLDNLPK